MSGRETDRQTTYNYLVINQMEIC